MRLGLVNEVCEHNELDQYVNNFVNSLLNNSPAAIAASKQLIREVSHTAIDNSLIKHTSERIAVIRVSTEGQEGLSAFLEKRPPSWIKKGRKEDK